MKFSNEILMAYADGELDAALRAQIETEMKRDPELARAVGIQIPQRAKSCRRSSMPPMTAR
jgi:anti-sigma factor RsiW